MNYSQATVEASNSDTLPATTEEVPSSTKETHLDKILKRVKLRNSQLQKPSEPIDCSRHTSNHQDKPESEHNICAEGDIAGLDDIQNLTIRRPLIDPYSQDFSYENLGFIREFAFDGLPDVHRWNVAVPDIMHDLAEGICPFVLELILTSLALEHQYAAQNRKTGGTFLKGLSKEVILQRFSQFKYFEGGAKLKWVAKEGFRFYGKAVQVSKQFKSINLFNT